MKSLKETQQEKLLRLLKEAGSSGINSHDATYIHGIKQAPTRILELKNQGYLINTSSIQENRSVNWFLTYIPEPKREIIKYEFQGNKAIPIYG